jgi:enhancing lycopene biosynthesis protein 2
MTKHRSHSAAFKRQVAEEFIAGETLHRLSKQHDIAASFAPQVPQSRLLNHEHGVRCRECFPRSFC